MANLQVKSIDEQLYKALGQRAAMENRSISQQVIHIIKAYLSTPSNKHEKLNEEFLALCGGWEDEKSAQAIADDLRENRIRTSHRDIEF